ncbi:MAG: DUF4304 domain-containing protein, partial [Sediminibacterium sp.]|nr:DUF4304 domain-containing protein [Sediminibacterium sp.]
MTPENLKTDFDEIFKGVIIPFFKDLGFKRKTQHFARQTNNITQCFNVQKSQWNSYHDDLSFTFNVGFYNDLLYLESWDRKETTDFPKHYDCQIQFRLGQFSHKTDHWYKLSPRIDYKKVSESIESDLNKYLLPLFDKYQTLDSFKEMPQSAIQYALRTSSSLIIHTAGEDPQFHKNPYIQKGKISSILC